MPFESRVFSIAKDPETPKEYEDAFAVDAVRSVAVVADGVASAIFSRQWANVLTEATISDTPNPDDQPAFADWLARQRAQWIGQIDTSGLAWFQKAKLPMGAFSTLLWVQLLSTDEHQEGTFGAYRLRSYAIGDSCMFHIRHGELLRCFPIENAAQLEADPLVLGSVDLSRDELMRFVTLDELCYPDDLLVLCTDAVADWVLRRIESGDPPHWDTYWNMSLQQWQEEIVDLRAQRQMRYDDATLMLLRVREEGFEVPQPEETETAQAAQCWLNAEQTPPRTEVTPVDVEVVEEAEPTALGDDRKGKSTTAGEQIAEGIDLASQKVVRGWKKWKKKAVDKYHEKFGQSHR